MEAGNASEAMVWLQSSNIKGESTMPDARFLPPYDKQQCLIVVLGEMDRYLDTAEDLLRRLDLPAQEKLIGMVSPLVFDAKVLHARNLYEFFHNIRTLSRSGEKIFNEINILCGDYGYQASGDKKRFYRLKCDMDEKVIHLTIRRDGEISHKQIMAQLDDFLLPDIAGFLKTVRNDFPACQADIVRLNAKCESAMQR
jgi:hypothetical protein